MIVVLIYSLLDHHGQRAAAAMVRNGLHLLVADVPLADEGVAVLAAATRLLAVVEVDEGQRFFWDFLDISERVLAAGEGVAGVEADLEARICDLLHEVDEGVGVRQQLRALARRRLEKQRTGRRGFCQAGGDVGTHGLERLCGRALHCLAHVHHDATTADGRRIPQVLAQQLGIPRTVCSLGARIRCQVDHVGGVHVDAGAGLSDSRRPRGQICIADGQLAALRGAQKDLVGLPEVAQAKDGLTQRLLFGHVAADEVGVTECCGHSPLTTRSVEALGCGRNAHKSVGKLAALLCIPGPHVKVHHTLLQRQDEVEILNLGREGAIRKELKEEGEPILAQLARQLHLKDLRIGARIRVALH